MPKHLNIKITGSVQGIFFRDSARRQALALNLKGFVKNESDGSVYIEAEGEENNLRQFVLWCHQGPNHARVENVEINEHPFQNFNDFIIKT